MSTDMRTGPAPSAPLAFEGCPSQNGYEAACYAQSFPQYGLPPVQYPAPTPVYGQCIPVPTLPPGQYLTSVTYTFAPIQYQPPMCAPQQSGQTEASLPQYEAFSPPQAATVKKVEEYTDNWNWNAGTAATIPDGATGILAFGIVNADSSLDPNYPVDEPHPQYGPIYPTCSSLAIGGWNNSQSKPGPNPWEQNNGLYKVLTSPDDSLRQRLIDKLVQDVRANGYKSLVIDYENYQETPPDPAIYTNFLIQLEAALKKVNPDISLKIAISPWDHNQRFYDIGTLTKRTDITFQVMCYDYAMGQSSVNHRFYNKYHEAPPTGLTAFFAVIANILVGLYHLIFGGSSSSITVMSNASIRQTQAYLAQIALSGVPLDRIMVGVPAYGLAYNIDRSLTIDQVRAKLSSGTLNATSYWNGDSNAGNGQVRNDYIVNTWIQDWNYPKNGWIRLENGESPPEIFYYNQALGLIVSATPPSQIDNLKKMVATQFPAAANKWFVWEGQCDIHGNVVKQLLAD